MGEQDSERDEEPAGSREKPTERRLRRTTIRDSSPPALEPPPGEPLAVDASHAGPASFAESAEAGSETVHEDSHPTGRPARTTRRSLPTQLSGAESRGSSFSMPPGRPTPSELEDRVGTRVREKYRLDTLLGQGGMGAVYAGTNEWTKQRVALKFLLFGTRPASRRRFFREAQAMGALDHPNIARVFDLGEEDDGSLFLVEELLEGEDLKALLGADRRVTLAETCEVLVPVMSALCHAHGEGILHRDIKPGNLFIARDKQGRPVPKVIDFGIAKNVAAPDFSSLTQGKTLGTPAYMSPEQAFGEENPGPTVDVWSLGAVLFRCLAGRPPYVAKGYAVLTKLSKEDPPRLDDVAPDVPRDIADVVAGALQRDVAARTATVAALLGALLEAPSVAETRWGQELRVRYGGDAVFRGAAPEAPADAAPGPGKRYAVLAAAVAVAVAVGAGLMFQSRGPGEAEPPSRTTAATATDEVPAEPGSAPRVPPVAASGAPTPAGLLTRFAPRWHDALLARQQPDGAFRGLPQLPVSAWTTGQAGAALFATSAHARVDDDAAQRLLDALSRFRRPRGYGDGDSGLDVVSTAWVTLAEAAAEQSGHAGARDSLRRAVGRLLGTLVDDGSSREQATEPPRPYANAVAGWALVEAERAGFPVPPAARARSFRWLRAALAEEASYATAGLPAHLAVGLFRGAALPAAPPLDDALRARLARHLLEECGFAGGECTRSPLAKDTTPRARTSSGQDQVELGWLSFGGLLAELLLAKGAPGLDAELRQRLAAYRDWGLTATLEAADALSGLGDFVLAERLLTLAWMAEVPAPPAGER